MYSSFGLLGLKVNSPRKVLSSLSTAVLSLFKCTQVSSSVLHHQLYRFFESRLISRTGCSVVFQLQNLAIDSLDIRVAAVDGARI